MNRKPQLDLDFTPFKYSETKLVISSVLLPCNSRIIIIDMSRYVIPESTTEVFYPLSKRKKIVNHKGEIIYDSAKVWEKDKNQDREKFAYLQGL